MYQNQSSDVAVDAEVFLDGKRLDTIVITSEETCKTVLLNLPNSDPVFASLELRAGAEANLDWKISFDGFSYEVFKKDSNNLSKD